jgi:ribonuclease HI
MKYVAWVDGGGFSSANTDAFIGAFIVDAISGEVLCKHSQHIGKATVNEAEYSAVIFAIYWAIEHGGTHLKVKSDSQLVVNQILGKWKINDANLKAYLDEVHKSRKDLVTFEIEWVPREDNIIADSLSRKDR